MEANLARKNKELKEKDKFIMDYLIKRIKPTTEYKEVLDEIKTYFPLCWYFAYMNQMSFL